MAVETRHVDPELQQAMDEAKERILHVLYGLKGMHRLSDERLGERLGMSRQAIQGRLSGSIDISAYELAGFAAMFGADVADIYAGRIKAPLVHDQLTLPAMAESVVDAA